MIQAHTAISIANTAHAARACGWGNVVWHNLILTSVSGAKIRPRQDDTRRSALCDRAREMPIKRTRMMPREAPEK